MLIKIARLAFKDKENFFLRKQTFDNPQFGTNDNMQTY